MDWLVKMNEAIDYIEEHLSEKIDYKRLTEISCCSIYNFQRMFSYMTEVSLADYIRFRRMTKAAEELKNNDIKIVDLAYKYGYESPEAFSRAFQGFHSISPSSMKKLDANCNIFNRVLFPLMFRERKEHDKMSPESKIIEKIVNKAAYSILGLENKKSTLIFDPKLPPCWDEFFCTNAPKTIDKYRKEAGFMGAFCSSDPGYYNYLIGAVVDGCQVAPEGMFLQNCPSSEYVIVSHEPVHDRDTANAQIGRLVGFVHGGGWQCPEGYERYYNPIMFIEFYPPELDGKFFVELWIPIRKTEGYI